jgi:maltose alpha-D-glucosyltransferase/alpha-amylase
MVTPEERQWMWEQYAPDPRMRLNLGIRRRLAPLLDNDARKIKLIHSLLLSLPGSPIIYYGDEIGMGENIWLPDRNGVRTPMQWTSGADAGFSCSPQQALYSPVIEGDVFGPERVNVAAQQRDPSSLWHAIRHMLQTRKAHRAFGWGRLDWLDCGNDHIAAYWRRHQEEQILAVHNLSDTNEMLSMEADRLSTWTDLLANRPYSSADGFLRLELAPYEYLWLRNS